MGKDKYEQMNIFDYIPKIDSSKFHVGEYIPGEIVGEIKGKMIPFADLEKYIGRRILLEMPRQSATDHMVIKVTSFRRDSDEVYSDAEAYKGEIMYDLSSKSEKERFKLIGKAHRIGYTTDKKKEKENSWVSEMYCANGRYKGDPYSENMYELL